MTHQFYKNPKTKLWDERISAEQIITNLEWELGLDVGDLKTNHRYPLLIHARKIAAFRLRIAGYIFKEVMVAMKKPRWRIKRGF